MSAPTAQDAHASPSRFGFRTKFSIAALAVIAAGLAARQWIGTSESDAKDPARLPVSVKDKSADDRAVGEKLKTVALVNGEAVGREQLAQDALRHYGKEVLESVLNKQLIADYCKQHGIVISNKDIDDEIEKTARKFNLPVDQWLKMLKQERGINPQQYAKDIVWPTVALRKLAASRLTVSEQEIAEAFESEFGAAVKARLIVVDDAQQAAELRAKAAANPDDFGNLARRFSQDVNSASINGLIQPIRRHVGDKKIEQAAFQLPEGGVSQVIPVGNQFAILKCEGHVPTRQGAKVEQVKDQLAEAIRDRKLRTAAAEVFKKLQQDAQIENVLNDPGKRQRMPGVAATINGTRITLAELGEECLERHGVEVLETTIHRKLLEQGLRSRKLNVTQSDIDAEIARAAVANNKTKANDEPDVAAWEAELHKQGINLDTYVHDSVWPSAALKKLTGEVRVTQEDVEKGYEANYGPRCKALAIVMNNQRRAQEVWERARNNPTPEFFAQLAEQYSVEPSSKANGGRVPPIPRNGGNPMLEKEAFALKPGELSSVICVGDKFIVLFCEGYTEPTKVSLASVQSVIVGDIHEKKQRIEMAKTFEELKELSRIDNYLAPANSHVPKQKTAAKPGAAAPAAPGGKSPFEGIKLKGDERGGATASGLKQPGAARK